MRNRRIGTLAKTAALLTLCIAAASAFAGCSGHDGAGRPERTPEQAPGTAAREPSGSSDRSMDGQAVQHAQPSDGEAAAAEGTYAPGVEPNAARGAADSGRTDGNGWFAEPPALLGIAIGAPEADVKERFGDPEDTFRLHDPPATVLEYDGFAVGIGEDGRVQYIVISGEDVGACLGGPAVGGTADDVMEALGEPDQASDTVLLYRQEDVSLKFDFDPNTKRIASILLFAEH